MRRPNSKGKSDGEEPPQDAGQIDVGVADVEAASKLDVGAQPRASPAGASKVFFTPIIVMALCSYGPYI